MKLGNQTHQETAFCQQHPPKCTNSASRGSLRRCAIASQKAICYAIAVGRFKGGDRLPERRLCEMTGVSRTLVREALRQLESEGLIEVVPNRGPIVACVTAEQVKGIYQVRAELEGLAFQLFAEQATTKQRDALVDAFKKLKRSIKDADPLARLRAKDHFYECVMEGSGNDALRESLRLLNARALLLRARSLRAPGRVTTSPFGIVGTDGRLKCEEWQTRTNSS